MRGFPERERDAARSGEQENDPDAAELVAFGLEIDIGPLLDRLFEGRKKKAEQGDYPLTLAACTRR